MKRSVPDPRALESLSFGQLAQRYPHHARALRWLHACRVLSRADFERVVWPQPALRQTRQHGLNRMIQAGLVEAIDEQRAVLQLGRRGASLLTAVGCASLYRQAPGERVLPGLLIASTFATSLGTELLSNPYAQAMCWRSDPFLGQTLRPDGWGTLVWARLPCCSGIYADILQPHWTPAADEQVASIVLEIDRCSERARALDARFRAWAKALRSPEAVGLPDQHTLVVVWVTTGTWRRVNTLQAAWKHTTVQSAYFTTVYELRGQREAGPMSPLSARWLDRDGHAVVGWRVFRRPTEAE